MVPVVFAEIISTPEPPNYHTGLLDDKNLILDTNMPSEMYDNDLETYARISSTTDYYVTFKYPANIESMFLKYTQPYGTLRFYFKDYSYVDVELDIKDSFNGYLSVSYSDVVMISFERIGSSGTRNLYEIDFFGSYNTDYEPPETPVIPPAAPTGLKAIAGNKEVFLSWNANSEEDLLHYKVYRDSEEITTVTDNTYSDTDVVNGVSYTYQVSAVNQAGIESNLSLPVTVTPEAEQELLINLVGNYDSIIVQVVGGIPPYSVDWGSGSDSFNASQYRITGLTPDTDYTVTVTDSDGQSITETVNTGTKKGFVPPVMPSPQSLFQQMINNFGDAGKIALAVISAAVSLGVIVILGLWGWRLTKKWLATSK